MKLSVGKVALAVSGVVAVSLMIVVATKLLALEQADTWVAIFTAALFVSTVGLWWATATSIRHAREAVEIQLRAYVVVTHATITGLELGETPTARINLQNVGQTPANRVISWVAMTSGPYPDAPLIDDPGDVERSPTVLGTGVTYDLTVRLTDPLSSAELAELIHGSRAVFVYGQIQYEDVFGKIRETTFRVFKGGGVGIVGTAMVPAREGNAAT